MGLQREKLLGGAVALVGVLLALPSVVAPTWHMTISDREHGALLSEQWEWSWGRSRLTGAAGVELQDLWNLLGLTIFVVFLVAACAAVAFWVLGGPSWAALAGPVAVAALAGRLVTTSAERHGRTFREGVYGASGLTMATDTPTAGVLESTAVVVLLVALAVMAFTHVGGRLVRRDGESDVTERLPVTASLRPEGEHLSTTPVSFGDAADEERR